MKPRREIFLPLMKSTFSLCRHYILHDAMSVQDILHDYPALKEACAVRLSLFLNKYYDVNMFID